MQFTIPITFAKLKATPLMTHVFGPQRTAANGALSLIDDGGRAGGRTSGQGKREALLPSPLKVGPCS